jgi:HAMP domain-containing protein
MIQKFKKFYKELTLLTKLRALSVLVTILLFISLLGITFLFNRSISRKQIANYSKDFFTYAAQDFNSTIYDIIQCFIYTCGTEEFKDKFYTITQKEISENSIRYLLQEDLQNLTKSHSYIDQAIIIDNDNYIYSLYSSALDNKSAQVIDINEIKERNGIQLLPMQHATTSVEEFFPLIIPLYISGQYIYIDNQGAHTDLYLVLFLNAKKVSLSMHRDASNVIDFDYYLYYPTNDSLAVLNTDNDFLNNRELEKENLIPSDFLNNLSSSKTSIQSLRFNEYYYLAQPVPILGANLVMVVKEKNLWEFLGEMKAILLGLALISLVFISTASYFSTNYVSRPILKLLNVVKQIEKGSYEKKLYFQTDDEIGQLVKAINLHHFSSQTTFTTEAAGN